jgi:hypothetical protein
MSYKAYALGQRIGDELAKRLTTMTPVTVGTDGSGNTTIACGAGTAGSKSAFIRLVAAPTTPSLNAIGQAADSYTPSIAQLVTESVDSTLAHQVGYLTPVELASLMAVLITFGTKLDWYQSANGVAPAVGGITGTPVASVYPNLYNGARSSQ